MNLDQTRQDIALPDTPQLRERARELLAPFGFEGRARGEMWRAYREAPQGVEMIVADVLDSLRRGRLRTRPAGAILAAVRRGEHQREQKVYGLAHAPKTTGWRVVYGDAHQAMTYVADPAGTDPLPDGYDTTTHPPPGTLWTDQERADMERRARLTQQQTLEISE